MAARTTMSNLITTVRGFCNAGTADYTIGSTAYWSDEQLQTVLDRYRVNLREVPLTPHSLYNSGGTVEYKEYQSPQGWMEASNAGTARFVVTDGIGGVQGTALWGADYETGLVTFVSDQAGSARYVTGYSYDVYAAAADIWDQMAASYARQIDFSTDNHSVKRSHIVTTCQAMAKRYQSMATVTGSTSADVTRGDTTSRGEYQTRVDYD
jgi:hypothetical protein